MTGRSMAAYQEGYSAGERAGRIVARDQIDALAKALEKIAAMDPKGIRADDLGRASRIAADALRAQ